LIFRADPLPRASEKNAGRAIVAISTGAETGPLTPLNPEDQAVIDKALTELLDDPL